MPTMKAARLFGPRDLRLMEVPLPELRPHDVLCRVVRSGICGTDYAIYSGQSSFAEKGLIRYPMTPGHEWSGTVAEVGPAVEGFRPGDRVVGDTGVSCGICEQCLVGRYDLCPEGRAVGTINAWDGAYAEYIAMPERHLYPLPEAVTFDHGAMVEPAATALHAVRRAGVGPGETVLVTGTGPIGIMAAAWARLSGAAQVLIAGRKPAKLELAQALGADVGINTCDGSLSDAVRRSVGKRGVDRVVEASGSAELLLQSLDAVRAGGTVATVAFYEGQFAPLDPDRLVLNGITLRGVAGSLGMYRPVLDLMAAGRFDPTPLITGRYPFEQVLRALADMEAASETRVKLMLEMPPA